jgi:streptogramin lyase
MKSISILSAISIGLVTSFGMVCVANAEIYKTDKQAVVMTGLDPKSTHTVQTTNAKGKTNTRKAKAANSCGELLITSGAKYPTLLVDTQTITTSSLTTKVHATCKAPKKAKVSTTSTTTPQ